MRALHCAIVISLLCSTVLYAQKEKKTVDLLHEAFDVRDALLEAAAKGKIHLIIAPGVFGSLTMNTKDKLPAEAIKLLAASVGCVVTKHRDITLIVPAKNTTPPNLPELTIADSKKTKSLIVRSAEVRQELLKLAKACELPIIIGRKLDSRCTIKLGEVPIKDALEALAWVNGFSWTILDKVVFIGKKAEVDLARRSFDFQKR